MKLAVYSNFCKSYGAVISLKLCGHDNLRNESSPKNSEKLILDIETYSNFPARYAVLSKSLNTSPNDDNLLYEVQISSRSC